MKKLFVAAAVTAALISSPVQAKNLVEVAQDAGAFKTLLGCCSGPPVLAGALADGKDLTVFAPTDEAFAKLPEGTVEELLKPENKDKLVAILSYHVCAPHTDLEHAAGPFNPCKDDQVERRQDADGHKIRLRRDG